MSHSNTKLALRVQVDSNAYRNKGQDRRIRYTHTVGSFMWKLDFFHELMT